MKKIFICLCSCLLMSYRHHVNGDCNNPMHPCFLLTMIQKMEAGENVIFVKYGDGEFECMSRLAGNNCDGDSYHPWLAKELKKALLSLSVKSNTYIAKWWTSDVYEYFNAVGRESDISIPWAWYHLMQNADEFMMYDYMHQFVKFIKQSKRKKILFCNEANSRLQSFFSADICVVIPSKNWSFEYLKWKEELEKHLEAGALILTSGGMCSKVLINDITDRWDVSCLDIGSSFDHLARKVKTRAYYHTYEQELEYYRDLLPEEWEK